ncbi:MAG: AAA family ATPase [Myxococcales bacterium]|nr:AAA family ATPase [Myxococcales bacterium]
MLEERPDWNDYGFYTLFKVHLLTEHSRIQVGSVKIMERGMIEGDRPHLPTGPFERLDDRFASLGQDVDYYERLEEALPDAYDIVLKALRDVVTGPETAVLVADEPAFQKSLLRFDGAVEAYRTRHGAPNRELLEHQRDTRLVGRLPDSAPQRTTLEFTTRLPGFAAEHCVRLRLMRHQLGRVAAIVGKNGTGKTLLLAELAKCLVGFVPGKVETWKVGSILAISFSAFDRFDRPTQAIGFAEYRYIGLRPRGRNAVGTARELRRIREEMWVELEASESARADRELWFSRLELSDPRAGRPPSREIEGVSSGHQALAAIIDGLALYLKKDTFVIFDEPELHLHPNVLSAFLRVLVDALEQRDAFAIIATHSPIPLQELPREAISILERDGDSPIAYEYPGQSFGDNLSEIVRKAFRTDYNDLNFATLIRELVERSGVEATEKMLGDLSLSADLILRSFRRKMP